MHGEIVVDTQPLRHAKIHPAMSKRRSPAFDRLAIDELTIEDERSFRHVSLYADLKDVLRRDEYTFRVQRGRNVRRDRALLLNLTYWSPSDGGDILAEPSLPADVVTHVAWHHLTGI